MPTISCTVSYSIAPPFTASAVITPESAPAGTKRTITVTATGGVPPYTFSTPVAAGVVFTPVIGKPGQWTFTA